MAFIYILFVYLVVFGLGLLFVLFFKCLKGKRSRFWFCKAQSRLLGEALLCS